MRDLTSTPIVKYDGPPEYRKSLEMEGRKFLGYVKGALGGGNPYQRFVRKFNDGTIIEVQSINNIPGTPGVDIFNIFVPQGGGKPVPEKQKRTKEKKTEGPIPVPEVYIADTDDPQGWRIGDQDFNFNFYSDSSDKDTAVDPILGTAQRIVKYSSGNPDKSIDVDELKLERWETYGDECRLVEESTYTTGKGTVLPASFNSYDDCYISSTAEALGFVKIRTDPPSQPYYCSKATAGDLVQFNTSNSETFTCGVTWLDTSPFYKWCCGPSLLSTLYDPDGIGGIATKRVNRWPTYTYRDYSSFYYEFRDRNNVAIFTVTPSNSTPCYDHEDMVNENWWCGNVELPETANIWGFTTVVDKTYTVVESPEILNSAYNESTQDYALILEKRSDCSAHSIVWTSPFANGLEPYPKQFLDGDYTTSVYLNFNDAEYKIWEGTKSNYWDGYYYNFCREVKIYKYGEEFIVVFAVVCGLFYGESAVDFSDMVTVYGMLYKEEIHLSPEYPTTWPDELAWPKHEWPDLTVNNQPAYGQGLIHAALCEEKKVEEVQ